MRFPYSKTARTVQHFTNAAEIAAHLGGKRTGGQYLVRCVVHDDNEPSLALRDTPDGRLLVRCHAGCDQLEVLRALSTMGYGRLTDDRPPQRKVEMAADTRTGIPFDKVRSVMRRATTVAQTLGAKYLEGRGLDARLIDPDTVRFLPGSGDFAPALVAVITSFADAARVLGLQFTPLKADGSGRLERFFLTGSRPLGGVVRLVPDAEVTTDLGLAEGLETALAVMTTMSRNGRAVLPVWSAISANNLAALPIVRGLERLYVYADNDAQGPGREKAQTLARRYADAGIEARVALPKAGDWNTGAAR